MKKIVLATLFAATAIPAFAEPSCNPGTDVRPV